MPGAHKRRELRAVKMRDNIKDEVRYVQELHYIREMRKHLVHQLPQIFATTDPHTLSDVKPAIKVEPSSLVKKEPNSISEHSTGRDKSKPVRVATEVKNEIPHFFVVLATYLLGFGTLSLGLLFLWDPSIFEDAGLATKLVALVIGRLYTGTGLAMLILLYQNHLRALGTLLLCEGLAESVMMDLARNSGFKTDFLIGFPVTLVKGVLGWWMVNSRE